MTSMLGGFLVWGNGVFGGLHIEQKKLNIYKYIDNLIIWPFCIGVWIPGSITFSYRLHPPGYTNFCCKYRLHYVSLIAHILLLSLTIPLFFPVKTGLPWMTFVIHEFTATVEWNPEQFWLFTRIEGFMPRETRFFFFFLLLLITEKRHFAPTTKSGESLFSSSLRASCSDGRP